MKGSGAISGWDHESMGKSSFVAWTFFGVSGPKAALGIAPAVLLKGADGDLDGETVFSGFHDPADGGVRR